MSYEFFRLTAAIFIVIYAAYLFQRISKPKKRFKKQEPLKMISDKARAEIRIERDRKARERRKKLKKLK